MIDSKDIISLLAKQIAEQLNLPSLKENNTKVVLSTSYYTVEDVCKLLHISKATYYRHKDLGFIAPTVHVGRKPLFTQQAIDDYLANFL